MSTTKLRLSEQVTVRCVGSNKKITLPSGAVIEVSKDPEQAKLARVLEPVELEGCVVKVVPELSRVCVDIENEAMRKQYRESLDRCLHVIMNDFETLPALDSGTPMHVMRDLGLSSSWVPEPKLLKSWLHHINCEIPHPSLSVEQAVLPGNEKHLVLLLTQSW